MLIIEPQPTNSATLWKKNIYITNDTCHMSHDTWHMTIDNWHVTPDMWHLTRDTWHVTWDIGHMTRDTLWVLIIPSPALTVWDWQCLEDSEQKDHLINYLFYSNGVYRTAPATQALFNIVSKGKQSRKKICFYLDIVQRGGGGTMGRIIALPYSNN